MLTRRTPACAVVSLEPHSVEAIIVEKTPNCSVQLSFQGFMDTSEAGETQPGRKRRNRWGDSTESTTEVAEQSQLSTSDAPAESKETQSNDPSEDAIRKSRKSRWGGVAEVSNKFPTIPVIPEEVKQQIIVLQLQLQQINQKLLTVVQDALLIEQDPRRSPSPPPRYDAHGKRTNTREVRMRESLSQQRLAIIEQLIKIDPFFSPPSDYVKPKPVRRIYIPVAQSAICNFVGLIIGPRGSTQKAMEQETGTKISVRGKGSAKDPSKGRVVDEDEPLHVHISGESEEQVEKAAKLVEALLNQDEASLLEHKQKQLKHLALINGTLQEDEYCPICGEKGHKQFECPYRAKAFKAAGVKCSICGDLSHPTRDCPLKQEGAGNVTNLDAEYDSFLAELGGDSKSMHKATSTSSATSAASSPRPVENKPVTYSRSGTTVVEPIVDIMARKPQTIIKVSTVMTGAAPPSSLFGSGASSTSATTTTVPPLSYTGPGGMLMTAPSTTLVSPIPPMG
ncbi:hypothetical protein EON64_05410, partial [archaeon]